MTAHHPAQGTAAAHSHHPEYPASLSLRTASRLSGIRLARNARLNTFIHTRTKAESGAISSR